MAWLRRRPQPDIERAFLDEVFVHWEGLYRFALRLTGDPATAEDLVQESLTKGFKAFPRLRPGTNHRAWIFTIVRNTFISRARRGKRETELPEPQLVPDPAPISPDAPLVRKSDGFKHGFEDEVLAALEALPEHQRTAVMLCDVEGLAYDEIAEVLGCPIGTVRSRIHHARKRLRAALSGYAGDRGYDHVEGA